MRASNVTMFKEDPIPGIYDSVTSLDSWVRKRNYLGIDPYDALASPIIRKLTSRSKWMRIAATQFFRRFPVDIRPIVAIRRGHNPKALGLFLSAAALMEDSDASLEGGSCKVLGRLLSDVAIKGYSGRCWGYNFPWQSRAFFLPSGTPTVVNTAFCGRAMLRARSVCRPHGFLADARSACHFMMRDLHHHQEGDGVCLSYTPIDRTRIHNASMLGASLLARVGAETREKSLLEEAKSCARYLIQHQRDDGSWYYADTSFQDWIDSFHTGFVLDSLADVIDFAGFDEGEAALERGFRFFEEHFFEDDGRVKYYHDRVHPIDIHCPTQALVTLVRLWDRWPRPELIDKVTRWMIDNMRDPTGYFYSRIGRSGRPNKIPYIRWGQAWALYALATVLEHRSRVGT